MCSPRHTSAFLIAHARTKLANVAAAKNLFNQLEQIRGITYVCEIGMPIR